MRKLLLPVIGVAAIGAALVTPSLAQTGTAPTTVTVNAKVSPSRAGTKTKPAAVKLQVHVEWQTPGDDEKPVIQAADALFPKGSLYNGAKYPSCTENTLSRKGLQGCPKGSIMGTGKAVAYADTVLTYPKITVVNGGKSKVYLYTVMNNPARVQAPVPGTITKMSGKWAYKLHLVVPQVLQIVAGIPIALKTFDVTAGGKNDWLATTDCPSDKKWPFSVETFYSTGGSGTFQDSVACH
jgi:hypothetical protein